MTTEQYVSSSEAAEMLGVSRQRVSAMVRDGILPAVRPWPRAVRIPVEAIEAHLSGDRPAPIHVTALRAYVAEHAEGTVGIRRLTALSLAFITDRRSDWPEGDRREWARTMGARLRGDQ